MHTFFQFVEYNLRICFSNLFQCYPFGLTHCWLSTFQCQAVFPSNKKEKTKILKTISYHLRDPRILCICSHFCGFKDTGNAKQLRIAKKNFRVGVGWAAVTCCLLIHLNICKLGLDANCIDVFQ